MDQIEIHWVWWVAAAIVLGVIEVLTLDLVLLMFAVGAVAALVASVLGASVTVQVLAFAGTSIVMLLVLRPYLLRNLRRTTPLIETNAAGLVGRTAIAMTEVTERSGTVSFAGEQWSARTASTRAIPPDADVRVVAIDGATAVVAPVDDTPPPAAPQPYLPEDKP